ncbi:MAG: phosphohydrolase [Blastopirellula sp.]|nr:MAG: phosphohydrolase [Blastopirellula sp.]
MNQLLHAIYFAAEKHKDQRRKNSAASPYINHPIEVAEHLNRVGKIVDEEILIAALLHDTIEDTNTTNQEIRESFGENILGLVLECTDDKSLEKSERKRLQILNAPKKSVGAKLIKISDKTCNLKSILLDPPVGWTVSRQLEYFQWASTVYDGLKGVNNPLDSEIETVLKNGIESLSQQVR